MKREKQLKRNIRSCWNRHFRDNPETCVKSWRHYARFYMWARERYKKGHVLVKKKENLLHGPKNSVFIKPSEVTKNGTLLSAWGITQSMAEWARDPEISLSATSISNRYQALLRQLDSDQIQEHHLQFMLTAPLYTMPCYTGIPQHLEFYHDDQGHLRPVLDNVS